MIMAGMKFMGDVPFRDVYITGLVRDERGQKMSKTKGNVVDPLEVMDEYGADAVRFTLTAMAAPGMDIPLSEGRMNGYRQFVNKIWNASRFVLMNLGDDASRGRCPRPSSLPLVHRWILSRLNAVTGEVQEALDDVPLRRGGRPAVPLLLARVLRLVHRDGEAAPAGGGRRARHGARRAASRCTTACCGCCTRSCRS